MKYFIYCILFACNSYAASTGSLQLRGTVAANCNINVVANGSNLTLDIVSGETDRLIGTSNETCNNGSGYKINIKSDNGGELRHTSTPTFKTTYSVKYGMQSVTPTTTYQQVKNVTSLSGPANTTTDVYVSVTASANAMAGTYEDVVTLQIVANP